MSSNYGFEVVSVIDVSDLLELDPKVGAFVGTFFQMADRYRFTTEEFASAIARIQLDFGQITNSVPVDSSVFDFLVGGEKITGEMADTIDGMCSDDYKERFVAEYRQLTIRLDKLKAILKKSDEGTLDFKLACPISVLKEQAEHMENYQHILRHRARIEGIDLRGGK